MLKKILWVFYTDKYNNLILLNVPSQQLYIYIYRQGGRDGFRLDALMINVSAFINASICWQYLENASCIPCSGVNPYPEIGMFWWTASDGEALIIEILEV